jgi:type III pantothenate kinase
MLLDLGNSRLKAAVGSADGGLSGSARRAIATRASARVGAALGGLPGGVVTRCAPMLPGGGGRGPRRCTAWLGCARGVPAREREAAGVRCAYAEPARLGADRWAALLGARGLTEGACLVADAGSALTLDAMAPGGSTSAAGSSRAWHDAGGAGGPHGRPGGAAPCLPVPDAAAAFPVDTGPAMEQGARSWLRPAPSRRAPRLEAACGGAGRGCSWRGAMRPRSWRRSLPGAQSCRTRAAGAGARRRGGLICRRA